MPVPPSLQQFEARWDQHATERAAPCRTRRPDRGSCPRKNRNRTGAETKSGDRPKDDIPFRYGECGSKFRARGRQYLRIQRLQCQSLASPRSGKEQRCYRVSLRKPPPLPPGLAELAAAIHVNSGSARTLAKRGPVNGTTICETMPVNQVAQPLAAVIGGLNGDHKRLRSSKQTVQGKSADVCAGIDDQPVVRPDSVHRH